MSPDFFRNNRDALCDALDATMPAIFTAHTGVQRIGDSVYTFTQEPNFYYLTGIVEADWRVVILGRESWLVTPDRTEVQRTFDGGISNEEAMERSGIGQVLTEKEYRKKIQELAVAYAKVALLGADPHAKYYGFAMNPAVERLRRSVGKQFSEVIECHPMLSRLRAIKQDEEIRAIREAIEITKLAFSAARSAKGAHGSEYELQAEFDYVFSKSGMRHAYDPIVAGASRACTLHYIQNDQALGNEPVLLDIGAVTPSGYSADISRSWWLNGEPTARYKEVHASVLAAQQDIIRLITPGRSLAEYVELADERIGKSVSELGLGKSHDKKARRRYMPHAVSHGLGLEVHDSLGGYKTFEPGMVLTVEPGIYIPDEGFGVRIEDDILVTESGYENLSSGISTEHY